MIPRLAPALLALLILAHAGVAPPAPPDWKAVEQALGKSGQLQAGDVFRIGMPRTDLAVTVKGVPVKAGFALGSYAAFVQAGDAVMVMGDLVLLDQEVPTVMSGLYAGGFEVTAVHNHLNEMSPHVMYMHYEGHGDAVQLAAALGQALRASGTPLGAAATPADLPPVKNSIPRRRFTLYFPQRNLAEVTRAVCVWLGTGGCFWSAACWRCSSG